ncbi:transcription factor Ouib [Drosophila albomicans]|uniref:Transcription factor Ouib n=1 Tax=Drosophila albomicans TaxID=7291 RepID=A0A6P8XLN0_DROAB|nr:transcription factor Ouib [Drosophila albomicans]
MLQNICRICAIDTNEVTKLFEKSARKLVRQIKLLTGVFLESKPDLPDVICNSCLEDLHCAIEFRRRCLLNHKRWKPTKLMESESGASTRVICMRRSTRSRMQYVEDEAPLSPVEVLIKVEQPKCNAIDDDIDHLEPPNQTENDNRLDLTVSEEEELYVPPTKGKLRSRSRLMKATILKQPRTKQKLPVFFCDQCGNNVTGKSAFDRHLRKHSGIRPFKCEQCPARFFSAGELKGHLVMHTGDRNFPCRYCERTYVNYSGRLRHERTHTNERPFACDQCGKTFTNSYILKNHMLVHTGERMFRCDLCDRAFSRPTHLKTHYRSNTHKHNLEKSSAEQLQPFKTNELQTTADIVSLYDSNEDPQVQLIATVDVT